VVLSSFTYLPAEKKKEVFLMVRVKANHAQYLSLFYARVAASFFFIYDLTQGGRGGRPRGSQFLIPFRREREKFVPPIFGGRFDT